MLRHFLLFILLTPSLACAFDGVFTMKGVTQRYYFSISEFSSVLYYTIKAKQRVQHRNSDIVMLSYKRSNARQVLEYKNGSLILADSRLNFGSAYFHQGTFYMENVTGMIGGRSFTSREVSFDTYRDAIEAEHIVLRSNNRVKVEKGYSLSTLPISKGK